MKNLDIFGEPVRILLNKQFSIQTTIGGYLTILTIIMILVFTWFIGRDLVYKERPISYMQKDIFTKFQNISINQTNFPFSFTMMDDDNVPLVDYTYLTLKLYEIKYHLNPENQVFELINNNEIPVRFCNYSDFPLISEEQFDETQLGYTLCPEKNDFNLYGYWSEANLNYLQISIERCKNKTETGTICKTPQQIEEFIAQTGTNLNILYVDSRVRINNNTHPLEYLSLMSYKYVVPDYYKKSTYKIQSQNIMTDNGFIFSENEKTQFFRMVEEFTDIRVIDPEDYQFLVFEIFSSNISETYYRRYIKVPDIMASLGGILKIFTIAFFTLNTVFSAVEKNISIVNEVFVLNKKKADSFTSYEDGARKLDNTNVNFIKHQDEKILNNNYINPDSISSKKNTVFSPINNLNSTESKTKEKGIEPNNLAPFESPKNFYKKTKVRNFTSFYENFNFKNENGNVKPSNKNLESNQNFAKNNFFKHKFQEEDQITNNHMEKINTSIEKYLTLRKSETKLLFGFNDVVSIICNSYCNRKIPKKFKENFNFYEKARNSVAHYFDFILMIKKFEEINILKNCLLSDNQSKMIEIMCKPILSSKNFLSAQKTIRNKDDSDELYKDVNDFLNKVKIKEDRVDRKIIKLIEENVRKSHV